jgi:hypothetical protein
VSFTDYQAPPPARLPRIKDLKPAYYRGPYPKDSYLASNSATKHLPLEEMPGPAIHAPGHYLPGKGVKWDTAPLVWQSLSTPAEFPRNLLLDGELRALKTALANDHKLLYQHGLRASDCVIPIFETRRNSFNTFLLGQEEYREQAVNRMFWIAIPEAIRARPAPANEIMIAESNHPLHPFHFCSDGFEFCGRKFLNVWQAFVTTIFYGMGMDYPRATDTGTRHLANQKRELLTGIKEATDRHQLLKAFRGCEKHWEPEDLPEYTSIVRSGFGLHILYVVMYEYIRQTKPAQMLLLNTGLTRLTVRASMLDPFWVSDWPLTEKADRWASEGCGNWYAMVLDRIRSQFTAEVYGWHRSNP